jgi:glutamate synthase domain-containing protein 2/glutamate synthase domain-containing protein 1/glutamate synthase domain-containing protein 3
VNPLMIERWASHPGRGGCGVGAIADIGAGPSHELVELALRGLGCLEHRGGTIGETGDGAGLLLATDRSFFERFVAPGRRVPEGHHLSVGVLFFPTGEKSNLVHWHNEIDALLRRHGLQPLGWRKVPTDESALGAQALSSRRDVWQVLIGEGMVPEERMPLALFKVKQALEQRVRDLYVASFAKKTLVYKALATGEQLRRFYPDLSDPALETDVVVFHRRYSTNTFSNWYLAQVFRTLCHNGEINTIKANRAAVQNLEAELGLGPILMPQGSDSADVDRVVELFAAHGVPLAEVICRMMPMSFAERPGLRPEVVQFYRGVKRALGTLGAWEGPAALLATDGDVVVGALDRMGLRPLRWLRTRTGRVLIGSEIGAIAVPFEDVVETGQLDPGEALAVDLRARTVLGGDALIGQIIARTSINFRELAENGLLPLTRRTIGTGTPSKPDNAALNLFGWTAERIRNVRHMGESGKEPITSMGYDRPLAALSVLRPPLTKYFKQIVAVVTNPPIDPIREGGAFDLTVCLGTMPQAAEDAPTYRPGPQYQLASPILTEDQLIRIRDGGPERPPALSIDCTFEDPGNGSVTGAKSVSRRIAEIREKALNAAKRGDVSILILSDAAAVDAGRAASERPLPLPMVLVTSAIHDALVGEGLRRRLSLVVETGEVQEGHDVSVLLGSGADAVHPYLFFDVGGQSGSVDALCAALDETLRRIMSKMGICSLDGYRGSRLHEAVGVAPSVVEHYLPGVTSRIGGLELEDIYDDLRARHALGGSPQREPDVTIYRKEVWNELQTTARGHDPASFGRFLKLIAETPPVYLRDLLQLKTAATPTPLDDVAGEDEIIASCFRGAAMSHGALHRVAHRAIAAAFNELGAASNCGEGGEDTRRDRGGEWEEARSRIRQVASGRFGIDARYLVNADELSIKIGQGAKPGEGGMLPAAKVTEEVARIRKTQVGVTLISPPPHHDIYSIEDLAQLIYDLRQANPRARVSVKIPAVTDIGTIAVGIAKAGADTIDVSGFEGGTGAASASSIEHAGLPLERALSETHQALVLNGVRSRVRLRADGGIKTGFDVAAALALGADEVSIGTALMIAEQCIFCHGCANGMCPAGITTQSDLIAGRLMTEKKGRAKDEKLPDLEEERYRDAKQGVTRYLRALAGDLRAHLARVGLHRPGELVGRLDLLERKPIGEGVGAQRAARLDLAEIVSDPFAGGERPGSGAAVRLSVDPTSDLNRSICEGAQASATASYDVVNTDRAIGATLAGEIAVGRIAVPDGGFVLKLRGYAGQALGFACADGMRIELDGFANDTVGEAMGGGTIVLRPVGQPDGGGSNGDSLSICGNAACYGATGGALFARGRAGQRIGVRNSGSTIVVEGAGKYAFEYMTGGVGVVLGPIGPVIGSGMTGGVLYVLASDELEGCVHPDVRRASFDASDSETVRALLERHVRETGSTRAAALLADTRPLGDALVKLVPKPA